MDESGDNEPLVPVRRRNNKAAYIELDNTDEAVEAPFPQRSKRARDDEKTPQGAGKKARLSAAKQAKAVQDNRPKSAKGKGKGKGKAPAPASSDWVVNSKVVTPLLNMMLPCVAGGSASSEAWAELRNRVMSKLMAAEPITWQPALSS
jgi:hypothetical protein